MHPRSGCEVCEYPFQGSFRNTGPSKCTAVQQPYLTALVGYNVSVSNRYNREVAARAFRLASEATTTDDFAVPHLDHPPGTCIDCDAQRFLVNAAEIGISLHKIRRTLGGHGAERDPLQPPLLGSWCAAFPSTQAAEDAELTALQEDNGIVTPKFSDPDDHLSLERRISLHFEEIEAVRAQVEEWAANFDGEITHEEIRLFD